MPPVCRWRRWPHRQRVAEPCCGSSLTWETPGSNGAGSMTPGGWPSQSRCRLTTARLDGGLGKVATAAGETPFAVGDLVGQSTGGQAAAVVSGWAGQRQRHMVSLGGRGWRAQRADRARNSGRGPRIRGGCGDRSGTCGVAGTGRFVRDRHHGRADLEGGDLARRRDRARAGGDRPRLHEQTAQLPLIELHQVPPCWGASTRPALEAGHLLGYGRRSARVARSANGRLGRRPLGDLDRRRRRFTCAGDRRSRRSHRAGPGSDGVGAHGVYGRVIDNAPGGDGAW